MGELYCLVTDHLSLIFMDYFIIEVSEQEIKREKEKARELRATQWWKNRVAKGICHYCGGTFPPAELTMDHLVPIVRGGKSARGNVAPACKECNNKKKQMLPLEWEEYLQDQNKNQVSEPEPSKGGRRPLG
jgi:5-methylcytosine-specific restriction endonuclease McrA